MVAPGQRVDEAKFIELYNAGLDKYQIAEGVGMHPEAIRRTANRLGLEYRPVTPSNRRGTDRERFAELWNAGVPEEEIARTLGVSPASIRDIRRRFGLPSRFPTLASHDEEVIRKIAEGIAQRKTRGEIAAELNLHPDTVTRIRRQNNLPRFHAQARPRAGAFEPKYERDMVRQMIEEGMSNREVAEAIGCTPRTAARIRKELGLSRPPAPVYPPEVKQRALTMLQEGASYYEVGRTLEISDDRIRRWFPGMGWTPQQSAEYRHLKKKMDELDGKMRTGLDWV